MVQNMLSGCIISYYSVQLCWDISPHISLTIITALCFIACITIVLYIPFLPKLLLISRMHVGHIVKKYLKQLEYKIWCVCVCVCVCVYMPVYACV
jgi:hypothetical protein